MTTVPETLRENGLIDCISVAVLVLGGDLSVHYMNRAAESLLGFSQRRAQGRVLFEILPANESIREAIIEVGGTGHSVTLREVELNLVVADRGVRVDCTVTHLSQSTGQEQFVVEFSKVNRLTQLAREKAMVERHNASHAVIRGLAHEIRNPLGGLRGAAQLLDRELDNREQREFTRIIIAEADRLCALVNRLTGSYRQPVMRPLNVHQVLEHVRKLVSAEANSSLVITRDYDPSLPDVVGDSDQLIQALLNIVRNAVQAMEGRGRIVLRTRIERQFTVGNHRYRNVVRADVEDNGPGIDNKIKEQIFFPMVTSRPEGSGLGLAIAEEIICRHGGLIDYESEQGSTCFSIYLPVEEG
ncbi:MAG: nitrogen regulation protein NR(II) [Arenicellales bacterium]|nr:nitrogen regulation protein NR(II) [Arenicellales bacterium]